MAKPLKRGFWIEDEDKNIFVVVLYEKVPIFRYHCGLVGHDIAACTNQRVMNHGDTLSSTSPEPRDDVVPEAVVMPGESSHGGYMEIDDCRQPLQPTLEEYEEPEFGAWMVVTRRRGPGHGRGHGRGTSGLSCVDHSAPMELNGQVSTGLKVKFMPRDGIVRL